MGRKFKSVKKRCLICGKLFWTTPSNRFFCKKCENKPYQPLDEGFPLHIEDNLFPFVPEEELPIRDTAIDLKYGKIYGERYIDYDSEEQSIEDEPKEVQEKPKKLNLSLNDFIF